MASTVPPVDESARLTLSLDHGKPIGAGCPPRSTVPGSSPQSNGQACYWFSNGCNIGCDSCDGGESNPNTKDRCGKGMKPTNNDPYFRTYNRNVTAMSEKDM